MHAPAFRRFCRDRSGYAGTGGYLRVESDLALLSPDPAKKKILLIGSSITREDIDVDRLNAELGERGWEFHELGFDNGQPIDLAAIRERVAAIRPAAVVYLPHSDSFYGNYDFKKLRYWFSLELMPRLPVDIGWKAAFSEREHLVRGLLGKASFLYRYNGEISSYLEEEFFRLKARAQGAAAAPPEFRRFQYPKDEPPSYFEEKVQRCRKEGFIVTRYTALQRKAFSEFASRLRARKIPFIVIDAPKHPRAIECITPEYQSQYESFLAEESDELGFVFLRAQRLPRFSSEHFADFFHLNERGRRVMTGFLRDYFAAGTAP